MTILAALFAGTLRRLLGRRKGAVAAVLGIGAYTILVGANAAVVRDYGSGYEIFQPHDPGRPGFPALGGCYAGPDLVRRTFSDGFKRAVARWVAAETAARLTRPVGEYVLFTLAAQLLNLPVMAYHFGVISLVSLVANPLILPAQPPVMIVGGVAVLLGLVYYPLGQLVGYLALPFVTYTIHLVELVARIPKGELSLGVISLPVVLMFFIILFGWTFAHSQIQSHCLPGVLACRWGRGSWTSWW